MAEKTSTHTVHLFLDEQRRTQTVLQKREEEEKKKQVSLTIRPAWSPLALNSGMAMEENGRCCQTLIISLFYTHAYHPSVNETLDG